MKIRVELNEMKIEKIIGINEIKSQFFIVYCYYYIFYIFLLGVNIIIIGLYKLFKYFFVL